MSCPIGYNTVYKTNISDLCADSPINWTDIYGDSCRDYENNQYCTAEGKPGGNWQAEWGTFDEIGNPDKKCCACGGGVKYQLSQDYKACECPQGATDNNGVCLSSDPNKVIKEIGEKQIELCSNVSFVDRLGVNLSCEDYRKNLVCNPSAADRKGINWADDTFDTSILDSCCECGGGDRSTVKVPVYGIAKNCPTDSIYSTEKGDCVCMMKGTEFKDGVCQFPEAKCKRKMDPIGIILVLGIIMILVFTLVRK